MFCKGNFQSILLMLRSLKSFSNTLGLHTNADKSNIYCVNVERQCIEDVCELTRYHRGTLPFRYFEVHISARKISKIDCESMADKMTARIRNCGSRHLFYAGRVTLVNVVLLHIHSYWSAMFILPKQVLKNITATCRNFLWSGKFHTNKPLLIA